MDYDNERWIKVYTRDTASFLAMSWEAQGLGILLSRKMEATTGEISLGRKGLEAVIGFLGPTARWEKVEPFIRELLDEGRLEYDDERKVLVDRQHPARQRAQASPAVRKQMQRARAASPAVTPCHAESRAVTPCHDQREERDRETEERDARARVREDEPELETEAAPAEPASEPEPDGIAAGELVPVKPPEWFGNVVDTVRMNTGVDVDHRVAWSRYSAHRAKAGKPMTPMDAQYFVTTVDVVEAKRERQQARERIERRDEDEARQAARARRGMSPRLPIPKTSARAKLALVDDDAHVRLRERLHEAAERERELASLLGTGT